MNIRLSSRPVDKVETGAIVLLFFKDERPLKSSCGLTDWRMNGNISKYIIENRLSGDRNELMLIDPAGRISGKKILMVGMGEISSFKESYLTTAAKTATTQLVSIGINKFIIAIPPERFTKLEPKFASSAVLKGIFEFNYIGNLDVTLTVEGVSTNKVLFTIEKLCKESTLGSKTMVMRESLSVAEE